MAESTAKLREELLRLTGNKLDIQIDEKNFKSSFDILKELSEIWDEIGEKAGDVSQANILNLLGGKRNANVLASIITNFKDAVEASETASDSMGSAWAENEKYLNSIEGKTKQLQASFEALANSIISSDFVKVFIDAQRAVVDFASALNRIGALLPALSAVAMVVKAISDTAKATRVTNQITAALMGGQETEKAISMLNALTAAQQGIAASQLGNLAGVVDGVEDVADAAMSASRSVGLLGGAFGAATVGVKALGTAFKASLPGLAISLVVSGINLMMNASKIAKERAEEAMKLSDELQEKYQTATTTYESNIESLNKFRNRFDELNQRVGKNGTQGQLNNEEYAEYLDIVKQIVAISPGLADHYQNIGEEISGGYVNALQEAIAYQKELLQYERDSYIAKGSTLFDGYSEKYRQIRDDVKEINNDLSTTIMDTLNDELDAFEVSDAMEKIDDIFRMSSGEPLWDTKPTLENLEEMLGIYKNIDSVMLELKTLTREVADSNGNMISVPLFGEEELRNIRTGIRAYADSAKAFAEVKKEAFSYLYTYLQTDLSNMFEQLPLDQISKFRSMMMDAIVPTASLESNKEIVAQFTQEYLQAIADIQAAAESGDIEAAWAAMSGKYHYQSILDMIHDALFGVTEAAEESGEAAETAAKGYDQLAESLSNVSKAISFLEKAREGNASNFDMINAAQEFVDMLKEVPGMDAEIDQLFNVGEGGKITWDTSRIEEYIEEMIRARMAGTELAESHPEVVDALVAEALAFAEATREATSFSDAMGTISSTDSIAQAVKNFDGSEESLIHILTDLQGIVDSWNAIRDADNQVDLSNFIQYSEDGKVSFEGLNDVLEEYRIAMFENSDAMQALEAQFPGIIEYLRSMHTAEEEAAEATISLSDALSSLDSVMGFLSDGLEGNNPMDTLQNALKLGATWGEMLGTDANLWASLVTIDESGVHEVEGAVEHVFDVIVGILATEANLTEEQEQSIRDGLWGWLTGQQAEKELQDAIDAVKGHISDLKSAFNSLKSANDFNAGEGKFLDMLSDAYEWIAQDSSLNFTDFFEFDGTTIRAKASQYQTIIDGLKDKIVADFNLTGEAADAARASIDQYLEEADEAAKVSVSFDDALSSSTNADDIRRMVSEYDGTGASLIAILNNLQSVVNKWNEIRDEDNQIDLSAFITYSDDGKVSFDSLNDVLEEYEIAMFESSDAMQALEEKFPGFIDYLHELQASEVETAGATNNLSDAMSSLNTVLGFLSGGIEGDNPFETLQNAMNLGKIWGESIGSNANMWRSLVTIDENGIHEVEGMVEQVFDEIIGYVAAEAGLTEEQEKELRDGMWGWLKAKEAEEDFADTVETIKGHISDLKSAFDSIASANEFNAGNGNFLDMLGEAYEWMAKGKSLSLADFFDFDGENITAKTDYFTRMIENMKNAVVADFKLEGEAADKAREAIDRYLEEAKGFAELSSAVSNVNSVKSFATDIQDGEKGFTDMLSSAISLAEEFGLTLDQVMEVDEFGQITYYVENLNNALDASIDKLVADGLATAELAEQLKQAARAQAELTTNQQRIGTNYDNITAAISSASGYDRTVQLTYKAYQELIAKNRQYASTVEFVNGQLVINKDRYAQVTDEMIRETRELAALQAAQDRLKIEELVAEYKTLGDAETERKKAILDEIDRLELEINGYKLLASELDNASDAFARFNNASSSTEGAMHSSAQEAYNIINDTLKNADSARYGMIGNEKYKAAIDLMIGDIDVNTPAFDDAMAKLKRYFEDDKAGVTNFYTDLVNSGIIDATTGAFDTTITDISEKLGITEEAARSMMQQLEQYADEPFDWTKLDPDAIDTAAESAKTLREQLEEDNRLIEEAQQKKESYNDTEMNLNDDQAKLDIQSMWEGLQHILESIQTINKTPVEIRYIAKGGMSDGGKTLKELAKDYIPDDYNGNVDLTNRKIVPIDVMTKVNWLDEEGRPFTGDYATLLTNTFSAGDVEAGYDFEYDENVTINVTPIQADGTPLSPEELGDYVYDVVKEARETGKSIKDVDAENLNLLLRVNVVEDGTSLDDAYEEAGMWAEKLHDMQAEWDEIRFENNWFGDMNVDPNGVFEALRNDISDAQSGVDSLSASTAAPKADNSAIVKLNTSINTAFKNLTKLNGQSAHVTVYKHEVDAAAGASGSFTGKSWGFASARGSYRAAGGRTLVGELGKELVVDTARNRWYTVGDHGAEFVNLPKGAIVFNHMQTAQLLGEALKRGGLSMASGNAAAFVGKRSNKIGTEASGAVIVVDVGKNLKGTGTKGSVKLPTGKDKQNTQQASEAVEELSDALDKLKEKYEEINEDLEHYIEHQEQAYYVSERAKDYQGMITALQNEAEYYRQIYENSMQAVREMQAAGADDTSEELQEMEEAAWSAYQSMYDALDRTRSMLTDALNDEVDNIQSAVKTMQDMVAEYADGGKISMDTFQSLIENGIQYLGLLKNENGEYTLSADKINEMLVARKEQLAIETAMAYVSRIREALANGETEKLNEMLNATNAIGNSTWSLVYANLELAKSEGLSAEQYETALKNINDLRDLAGIVDTDIGKMATDRIEEIKSGYEELEKEIDHYIEHQEQAITEAEHAMDFDRMSAAYQNEIDYYQKLMDEASKAIKEMEEAGADDTDERLQALEKSYWGYYNTQVEIMGKLSALRIEAIGEEIDSIQSAVSNLKKASDEYNRSGGITVDTLQSILESGAQYLTFLEEEDGKLVLSTDAVKKYTMARKEQLGVEAAMNYVTEIKNALTNGETERVNHLIDAQNKLSGSTWSLVYAQAASLKSLGLTEDQYDKVIKNIDRIAYLTTSTNADLVSEEEDITESYNDQKDALGKILDYTKDLIRAETNDRIKAIKDEIDAFKKIVQLKKEALETTKTENEYQDEVADKVKEIAELQAKADLLALDTSRAATAERQKLIQTIEDKQKDLSKKQADYSYDIQRDALDKQGEDYEASRQDEITKLEESISSEEKIYQLAIERIKTQWRTLFNDLIEWNTEQGSVINDEITAAWEKAYEALKKYGGYLEAVKALETNLTGSGKDGKLVVADLPKYHSGGVVGDGGKLNDTEVLAVLQKGELVIDQPEKKGLYTIIDFVKTLGEKLGGKVGDLRNLGIGTGLAPQFSGVPAAAGTAPAVTQNNAMTFNPTFNVTITGGDLNPTSAREYGRQIADTAVNSIFEAFSRRGIGSLQPLRQ